MDVMSESSLSSISHTELSADTSDGDISVGDDLLLLDLEPSSDQYGQINNNGLPGDNTSANAVRRPTGFTFTDAKTINFTDRKPSNIPERRASPISNARTAQFTDKRASHFTGRRSSHISDSHITDRSNITDKSPITYKSNITDKSHITERQPSYFPDTRSSHFPDRRASHIGLASKFPSERDSFTIPTDRQLIPPAFGEQHAGRRPTLLRDNRYVGGYNYGARRESIKPKFDQTPQVNQSYATNEDNRADIEKIGIYLHKIFKEMRRGKPIDYEDSFNYDFLQTVQVRVMFQRITNIDTKLQRFDAELVIQARWPEPQFAAMEEELLSEIKFKDCWNPRFKLLNLINNTLECEKGQMVLRYEQDSAYPVLTYLWHIKGTFGERMELQHFPLDVQELSVVLSSERPADEIELIQDHYRPSNVGPRVMNLGDWEAYSHVTFARDLTTSTSLGPHIKHSVLIFSAHVKRNVGYYLWNNVFVLVLIICISFTVLALPPTNNARIGITVTLFLTTVAFNLVVKNSIPQINYLTYLDMYVIFILLYLAAQAFVVSFLMHLSDYRSEDKILWYEEIIESIIICLLILFHAIFIFYIMMSAMEIRRDSSRQAFQHQMVQAKQRSLYEDMASNFTNDSPNEDIQSALESQAETKSLAAMEEGKTV